MLAPDCDENGAYMLAERIRAAVHEALVARRRTTPLTISFGISTFPLHGQSADALLRTADQALYAAKRLGRNRSVISSAEVPGIVARAPRARPATRTWSSSRCSTSPRRSTCATPARPRTAPRRPLRRDHRARARASARRRRAHPARRDPPRRGARRPARRGAGQGGPAHATTSGSGARPSGGRRPHGRDDRVRGHPLLDPVPPRAPRRPWLPRGPRRVGVPLESSIIAVADAYEAMTSERPYRPALASEDAADELRREAGGNSARTSSRRF